MYVNGVFWGFKVDLLYILFQRQAGSSSDGTEDSDFSADLDHTDSSESDGQPRRSTRLTRSSLRNSQSSQGMTARYQEEN